MNDEEDVVDSETYNKLKNVIETLTHSGLKVLDESLMKEVRRICRLSSATAKKTYSLILYQLKKNHSEIRHVAFQMCVDLFEISPLFRELLVKDLQLIFELTAETNAKKKLPPPKSVAKTLEMLALSTIKKWNDKYGVMFKQIQIAFRYLKHSKKVNFDTLLANDVIEEQRKKKEMQLKEEKMKSLIKEIESQEPEIDNTVLALTNCLSLLVPSPENFFINEDKEDPCTSTPGTLSHSKNSEEDNGNINLKDFGIPLNYNLVLKPNLGPKIYIQKTEENSSIIQNAQDNVKLIRNRFLPLVKKWSKSCTKYASDNGATIQKILKIKEKIESCVTKFEGLNIQEKCDAESDSSDDDLEEVTKEHYEDSAPEIENFNIVEPTPVVSQKKTETEWKISVGEDGDPTSALSTIKKIKGKDGPDIEACSSKSVTTEDASSACKKMSRKEKLLACAPKLPFDVDLYHWEDQTLKAPTLLSIKMDNPKFWGASSVDDMDEIPNPEGVAALRTRVIEFSGKFEPVKWSCRAPLPNGKLCPRRDRFKCPFHGKIVARDEKGVCKNLADENNDKKKVENEWQDPELLEDIKAATGVDLKMPTKRGRSSKEKISKTHKSMKTSSSTLHEIEKRKFPGLSDTIGKQNNSHKRIGKKIFKKGALNRVAETMNKIDFAKHRDKFGDQFNYVYST